MVSNQGITRDGRPDSLPKIAGSLKSLIIDLQDKSRNFFANEDAIWKKILVYARTLSEDLDDMEKAVAYAKQLQKADPKDNDATYAVIELMLRPKTSQVSLLSSKISMNHPAVIGRNSTAGLSY